MDIENVRKALVEDLRGFGRRVPLSLDYDGAMAEWVALWRKDHAFRRYVAGSPSPLRAPRRRPRLTV